MQNPNDSEDNDQGESFVRNNHFPDADERIVFAPLTADYLLERGYCCGNGCKHCPYNYKAVAEPKRSYLLAIKEHHPPTQ